MHPEIKIGAMLELPVSALTTDYKKLLNSLTVNNPKYKNATMFGRGGGFESTIPKKLFFFELNKLNKSIYVPRNIDRKYFKGRVLVNNLSYGDTISGGSSKDFKLRPQQEKFFNEQVLPYIDNIPQDEPIDMLLNAECGSGKTVMSMHLSSLYKVRTVVCVTTKKIGNQFIKTVKDLFPNWTYGWYGDGKGYDIELITYASGSKRNSEYFDKFGHIILDEYHRCGADTYSRVLSNARCRCRTSLTATPRRKDGLYKILQLHAGKVLEMERSSKKATIFPIHTGVSVNEDKFRSVARFPNKPEKLDAYVDVSVRTKKRNKNDKTIEVDRGMVTDVDLENEEITIASSQSKTDCTYDYNTHNFFKLGTASAPMIDTEISEYDMRNEMAMSLIKKLYSIGRKVIVLSKRKEQLFNMSKTLSRYGFVNGVVVSEKDKEYIKYCKRKGRTIEENRDFVFNEARILLGIDKLAEEGMDAPSFDSLIYLHPVKDIEQSVGRVLRDVEGKPDPMAFYLIDKVNSYHKSFYSKNGAKNMFVSLGHKVLDEMSVEEALQKITEYEICN